MKELVKGHLYELDNLKLPGTTRLHFYLDGEIHNCSSFAGPSTQEVLRACISRVKRLNEEKPHELNDSIVDHLREAILLFECRANEIKNGERSVSFEGPIELAPVGSDGHIIQTEN